MVLSTNSVRLWDPFLNEFMVAGILMQQNSALDNLGEQTGVPEEGELN